MLKYLPIINQLLQIMTPMYQIYKNGSKAFLLLQIRTKTRLILINLNLFIIAAKTKYKDLRPRIAKILDVNTIKESVVTEKIAGIESTANITSVVSITIRTMNNGVICFTPFTI